MQAFPNDFSHLGAAGDCGIATSNGKNGFYEFTLQHKASYLCFLPRCMNTQLGPNIKLTKITVTADKPIAGTYDFSDGSLMGKTPTSGSSNTITLTTSTGRYFLLDNTTADIEANGSYMVIAPGTYNLTITYTVTNKENYTSVDIIKTENNFICPEGEIRDITANLTPVTTLVPPKHYMWDAKKDYWWGHEADKPVLDGTGQNWPKSKSADPDRWYNDGDNGWGVRYDAQTALFQTLPNVNELFWYVKKGDAHWDATGGGSYNVVYDGQLWQLNIGGLWIRKKSTILTYLKNVEHYPSTLTWDDLKEAYWDTPTATHKDYRPTNGSADFYPTDGVPANTADYFFLPAWGRVEPDGELSNRGTYLFYWSSSAYSTVNNYAYGLFYRPNSFFVVDSFDRSFGFPAVAFE